MRYHISMDGSVRIILNQMRIWLNGKISLCQGEDAGSIPAIRLWRSHGIG